MVPTRNFRWLLLSLALLALALDLGSKYGIFHWLYHDGQMANDGPFEAWTITGTWRDGQPSIVKGGRYNLVPGWMGLTAEYFDAKDSRATPSDSPILRPLQTWSAPYLPRVNHGALFGLGGEHADRANAAFAAVSLLAAGAILYWGMKKVNTGDRWLCMSLGLILGGTLGNLYDRVIFGGVRDFLYFYKIEWPVFNIADCCLVVGASMLLLQALFASKKADVPAAAEASVPITAR